MKRSKKSIAKPRKLKKEKDEKSVDVPQVHDFSNEEIQKLRSTMLSWYQKNKRDLPWRHLARDPDLNKRAYSVWVSEIMLQQTQVVTVIDYYNKWMQKWPTLEDLAKSSLEEVNEMWSGLGYYSRGRRLHEGAQKIVNVFDGAMPKNAESLLKELPGVGQYTSGAIASIAYNQQTGLVDGNVIRVLSRLRLIGADSSSQNSMEVFWHHANKLVPMEYPGDFNQAMMELGATLCTPKNPRCNTCPVQTLCKAKAKVEACKNKNSSKLVTNGKPVDVTDIECLAESCKLCLDKTDPWEVSLGVCNYPRKGKKKAAREERTAVCIVSQINSHHKPLYLLSQRPEKGLLAGLWEFPSLLISDDFKDISDNLNNKYGIDISHDCRRSMIGYVVHIFSHIHQTYVVEAVELIHHCETKCKNTKWVTKDEFMKSGVSTAMKKIFNAYEKNQERPENKGVKRKSSQNEDNRESKKQSSINSFFKMK